MAINFDLNTDKAVGNLQKLDQSLSKTLGTLGLLDDRLKSISSDKAAKKVDLLSKSLEEMKVVTSSSTSKLKKQQQVISDLKSQITDLTSKVSKLGTTQKTGIKIANDLRKSDQGRILEQQRMILVNKNVITTILGQLEPERQALIMSKALLDASNKRAKAIAEYNVVLGRSRSLTTKLSDAEKLELATKKETISSTEKLIQSQARLVKGKLRSTEIQRIQNEQRIKAQVLLARNNETELRAIAIAELKLSIALKEATAFARKELGLTAETKALNRNTIAKGKAIVATKSLNNATRNGNIYAAQFRAGLSALGANFGIFTGSTIVFAAGVFAIVKSFKEAIAAAAQFDFAMDRAEAVMAANVIQSVQLRKVVRTLAATTIFTARQVSEGLITLGMAGQSVSESLLSLEPTLRLAQIGMIDAGRAGDLLTNIMAAFNIEAQGMVETVDILSTVVTSSNTSITQLAQAISFVGPAAQATGTTLKDTAAILGFFADNGVKASRAGTALRRGIANLAAPTNKIKQALFDLGISALDPTTGRMKSMVEIIKELSANGATLQNVFDIFGKRAGPAFAAAILGDSKALTDLVNKLKDTTNATSELIVRLEDNQISNFKKALAAGEEALISFGEILTGVVDPVISGLTVALKGLGSIFEALEGPIKFTGSALLVFGSIQLVVVIGTWVGSLLGLTAALATTIPASVALHTALGFVPVSAGAAAVAVNGLRIAVSSLLGPLGILISIGVAVYFANASTAAERLAKNMRPVIDSLGKLSAISKVLRESSFDKELKKQEDSVISLFDRIEKLTNATGPTIGQKISSGLENALLKLKRAELILMKLSRSAKTTGKNMADFGGDKLKEDVRRWKEIVKLYGLFNKLAGDDLNKTEAQIAAGLTRGRANKEQVTGLLAAIDRQWELTAAIKATKDEIDRTAGGVVSGLENQRKANAGLLNETHSFLLRKLGIEEEGLDQIEAQLANNLKNKEILYDKTFKSIISMQEGFKALLVSRSEGEEDKPAALVDISQLEDTQNRLAKIYKFKDYQDYLDFLASGAILEKEIGDQRVADARAVASRLSEITLDQLGIELEGVKNKESRELTLLGQGVSLLETKLKSSYDARILSLSSYISEKRALLVQAGLMEVLIQEESLSSLTIARAEHNALAKKFDDSGNLKAWEQNAKAVINLDSKIRKLTEAIEINKIATVGLVAAINQTIDVTLNKAIKAATAAIVTQDAQINRNKRLADGFLSVAEANANYTIAQVIGTIATKGLTKSQEDQLVMLKELEIELRKNGKGINGLSDQWDAATNTMEGKAVSAAKAMQDAFVDYLINPTKDGFDDLLKSFASMIARMASEGAVKNLFNLTNLGKKITSFFDGLGAPRVDGTTTPSSGGGGDNSLTGVAGSLLEVSDSLTSNAEVEALNNENLMSSIEAFDFSTERMSNWTTFANEATNLEMENSNLGLGNVITGAFASKGAAATLTSAAGVLTSSAGNITVASTRLGLSADALTSAASALLAAANSSSGGGSGGILAVFGGDKALGGPVKKDKAYLVGEVGRELFIPDTDGRIVPNSKIPKRDVGGGGDVTFNNTINVYSKGSDKAEIRQMVKQGMIELEVKITRQQQRSQRTAGRR